MVVVTFLVRRLAMSLVLLAFVSVTVFWATNVGAGDTATRIAGRESSPEQIQLIREKLDLDKPVIERYAIWFGEVARGNLGTSLTTERRNEEVIGPALSNTLILSLVALLIYVPLVLLSALSYVVFRGKWIDQLVSLTTMAFIALPEFVVGTLALILFAGYLRVFSPLSSVDAYTSFGAVVNASFLPAAVLALVMAAYAARVLRGSLSEILDSDFMRMAELKGMSKRQRLLRYALPPAGLPALNVTALNITYLVGGVVIIETIFSYPGLGSLIVQSLRLQDATLVAASVLVASAIYIAANFVVDLASFAISPALRRK